MSVLGKFLVTNCLVMAPRRPTYISRIKLAADWRLDIRENLFIRHNWGKVSYKYMKSHIQTGYGSNNAAKHGHNFQSIPLTRLETWNLKPETATPIKFKHISALKTLNSTQIHHGTSHLNMKWLRWRNKKRAPYTSDTEHWKPETARQSRAYMYRSAENTLDAIIVRSPQ